MSVPNEIEDELEREPQNLVERAPAVMPEIAPAAVPAAQPPVADYIAKRIAENQAGLRQAQEKSNEQKLYANLAEGMGQMTAGLAHQKEFDPKSYGYLHENAKAPVEDYLAKEKNKSEAVKGIAEGNTLQRKLELQDPNSRQSQIARVIAERQLRNLSPNDPSKGEWLAPLGEMSAEDMKYLEKPIDQLEASSSREQIAKLKAEEVKALREATRADKAARQHDEAERKKGADQDKQYQKLRHDLESFRGNQSIQQAATGILGADKALDMIKNKDPNDLSVQDLNLFAGEMAKMASGGVPTEHGIQSLMPNNIKTKLAELQSFIASKPKPAQAAEYVKHNIDYLKDMKDTSAGAIAQYRRNIAKGYKHLVRPEDLQEAHDDYGLTPRTGANMAPQAGNSPPPPAKPPTKMVHGVKYVKVPGGWEEASE